MVLWIDLSWNILVPCVSYCMLRYAYLCLSVVAMSLDIASSENLMFLDPSNSLILQHGIKSIGLKPNPFSTSLFEAMGCTLSC
jgi:hypothetical protein